MRHSLRILVPLTIAMAAVGVLLAMLSWQARVKRESGQAIEPVSQATDSDSPSLSPDLVRRSSVPSDSALACLGCHTNAYLEWARSQHAWANRLFDINLDRKAFEPPQRVEHGTYETTSSLVDGSPRISTTHPDGTTTTHRPELVIGMEPLIQYLIPFPGGRLQTLDMSYDTVTGEWFNVYGEEDRQPHEWGYWKNRGMNWNSQCAFCHMTNLKKGYDPKTDTYNTTWDAMGITCSQCHGPMDAHLADPQAPIVASEHFSTNQVMDNCASCHSRRQDMTADFEPGDSFHDHFRLTLPDLSELYYPDGQVQEEDYVYGGFMMSRMGHKGITCNECHNPHSAGLLMPAENNTLCLSCHLSPGKRGATVIDLPTHSHHEFGTPGDTCIECHMPVSNFMIRDPRRDHRFSSPDPLMTKDHGIPNTCNRCHTEKEVDWAVEWAEKWYGDKLDNRDRRRTRAIARARAADTTVIPELLALAKDEEIDAWRTVLISTLDPWAGLPEVRTMLEEFLKDSHPLVRSAAVHALGPVSGSYGSLKPLRADPSRLVRTDAAWATLNELEREPVSYGELLEYINTVCDQPGGAVQQGQLALIEGRPAEAEKWIRKAVSWDPSAEPHHILGRVLHTQGKLDEAEQEFLRAGALAPDNADYPYTLALLYGEMNRPEDTVRALQKAVEIDPGFGRAWYNLGLAHAQQEKLAEAVAALRKAEELMPLSGEPAYARATIHMRMGDSAAARDAAEAALRIAPGHPLAGALLRSVPPGEGGF